MNAPPVDYEDERGVRLCLSRLVEPEDQLYARLREFLTPSELLRVIVEERRPDPPVPDELADRLEARRCGLRLRLARADPAADLDAGAAAEARYLIPGDAEWPPGLEDLGGAAPLGLWMIGGYPISAPAVSIVGARACTNYGGQVAGQFAAELAKAGAAIVSGAALGVDGSAHRGALAAGGVTVAVLACGIDRRYPPTHDTLIQVIGERGAVLAELPPGTPPTRFRFLTRNRLIAALGQASIVVEAAGRSGSLVTARLAADLGRAVFAVPGPVNSRSSLGTNLMLCDGAIPAIGGDQILAELGVEPRKQSAAAVGGRPAHHTEPGPESPATSTLVSTATRVPAPTPPGLSPTAVLVREALPTARTGRAADVAGLAVETGLDPPLVLAALGHLAACGFAVKTGRGWALR